jgi:hypothetical protein
MLTERHLIPNISPYTIQLNEVPVKNSPTTTIVRVIDIINGSVHYQGDYDEVAATPVEGQFFPDYNTSAYDSTWNTGTIQFSANDAGKGVEVTYSAKGTLTGVASAAYPSWWRDRGDGSDGDFYPTGNVTIGGRKNYRSVYIPADVTVTVNGFVDIRCQGMFINEGTINASGGGGQPGQQVKIRKLYGASIGVNGNPGEPAIGGGAGGTAGSSSDSGYYGVSSSGVKLGGSRIGSLDAAGILAGCYSEEILGGGGGSSPGVYSISEEGSTETLSGAIGGPGGGMIRIVTKTHKNTGTYISTGYSGSSATLDSAIQTGGGGGGGGVVLVVCERNLISGTASIGGGAGGAYGGSGGAGWYRVIELGVS